MNIPIIRLNAAIAVFLSVCICLLSCADENPLLVNPPSGTDSMFVRVVNFSGDKEPRALRLQNGSESSSVNYSEASSYFRAPGDSSRVAVIHNGQEEFALFRQARFSRISYHTFYLLPGVGTKANTPVDTVPFSVSAARLQLQSLQPTVRIINCFPDTTLTFSLRVGCPNGEEIARDNGYRSISAVREVQPASNIGIALMKNQNGLPSQAIGLYQATLSAYGVVTFIVHNDGANQPTLSVLDEKNLGANALQLLPPLIERTAAVRTINLSSAAIDIARISNGTTTVLSNGVTTQSISALKNIPACESNALDTLAIFVDNTRTAISTSSLQSLSTYTMFVLDSSDKKAASAYLLPQRQSAIPIKEGNCFIRVFNGIEKRPSTTISLGARTVGGQFYSSEVLAAQLPYSSYSAGVEIPAGDLPLTVFTPNQPANLLLVRHGVSLPGHSYILALWEDENGVLQSTLIDDSASDVKTDLMTEGIFAVIVNGTSDPKPQNCGYDAVLTDANIAPSGSLGTVLPKGRTFRLYAGTAVANLENLSPDSNYLFILTNSNSISAISIFSSKSGEAQAGRANRRFINLFDSNLPISVFDGPTRNNTLLTSNIPFGGIGVAEPIFVERRAAFSFWTTETEKVAEITNISFPLGKNYSIIVSGNTAKGLVIVQQEF